FLIERIDDPDFLFVGRKADAMARAAMALDRSFLNALNLGAVEFLVSRQITDFKAQAFVDADIGPRFRPVHREGTNGAGKRADLLDDLVRLRVGHEEHWR